MEGENIKRIKGGKMKKRKIEEFKGRIYLFLQIVFWQILRKSMIFGYWYDRFLTELLYDLQLHRDIEQKEIEEKYCNKLYKFNFLGKYDQFKELEEK